MRVRNRAYRQLRRCPVESLVVEYKQRRAEARKVIKCEKRESWQKFCGTLGSETTVKQVWNLIHRMAGINSGFSIPVLVEGCREVVSNEDKADLLVRSFQQVHSDRNVGGDGSIRRELMLEQEGHKLNKNNDNSDVINLFFSLHELGRSIRRGRHTTPGRDGLGYEIFQHMDDFALEEALALINTVWEEGSIPAEWKQPILKPGKEAEIPGSYRPIALTVILCSYICKIMERMVTDRLVHRLEKKGFFSTYQNGFRLGLGTMDSTLVLDDDIKKALVNKEVVVGVFFDIEKAYDML